MTILEFLKALEPYTGRFPYLYTRGIFFLLVAALSLGLPLAAGKGSARAWVIPGGSVGLRPSCP
jgi:hypothetical protein